VKVSNEMFVAAQAGDSRALDALLRVVQPDIRRYARYQCHRGSAIEDVVQEALIIVYRRVGTVRSAAALGSWAFRIVARLCLLPALALMRGVESLAAVTGNRQFATVPVEDLRIDLVRALESLPPGYREIVVLRDLEQLTISEIAARLNISREAAKSRLHRARALVREYLAGPTSADIGSSQ
jgi:DNA-directed RNA polymerase specialized sigma24 family protein